MSVSRNFSWKFDHIHSSQNYIIRLHRIRATERGAKSGREILETLNTKYIFKYRKMQIIMGRALSKIFVLLTFQLKVHTLKFQETSNLQTSHGPGIILKM